jgi:hypothetical protein
MRKSWRSVQNPAERGDGLNSLAYFVETTFNKEFATMADPAALVPNTQ